MTEKSEEQIAKEKAAVDSMRNARANMATVISRIESLESALRTAIEDMRRHKGYIAASAHLYSEKGKTLHDTIDDNIATAQRVLG